MAEPFLGEIRMFGFNFAPKGWAFCNGESLPAAQYGKLYSLLGNTYGGKTGTDFNLPDLRCRMPVHLDNTHPIGQKLGSMDVVLTVDQIPPHTHSIIDSDLLGEEGAPSNTQYLAGTSVSVYRAPSGEPLTPMRDGSISIAGNSYAHSNMMPYLAFPFCIAIEGSMPHRS